MIVFSIKWLQKAVCAPVRLRRLVVRRDKVEILRAVPVKEAATLALTKPRQGAVLGRLQKDDQVAGFTNDLFFREFSYVCPEPVMAK